MMKKKEKLKKQRKTNKETYRTMKKTEKACSAGTLFFSLHVSEKEDQDSV